jgi:hypothetical protein
MPCLVIALARDVRQPKRYLDRRAARSPICSTKVNNLGAETTRAVRPSVSSTSPCPQEPGSLVCRSVRVERV